VLGIHCGAICFAVGPTEQSPVESRFADSAGKEPVQMTVEVVGGDVGEACCGGADAVEPVLVTRVGWTLSAPWLAGMTARRHDFSLETYRTDKLDGPSLRVGADEPLFFVNLKRK